MGSDDQVIVIGGDEVVPRDITGSRRWPLPILLLVGALFVGLIAIVLTPEDETPTVVDPAGLEAPPEPPRAYVEPTASTAPAGVPELAVGWKPVAMAGAGWFVSDVAHGPSGWLAVSAGNPVIVHTSSNAVLWAASSLVELTGSDPQVAVGDGVMVVASVGLLDDAVFAALSDDGGETWSETLVDTRPGVVHGVSVIASKVYAFGEVLDRMDPARGEGLPVVWRHDDQGWAVIEDSTAVDGVVTGVLQPSDGSVRAFGQRDGASASWVVGDTLAPVAVEVPPALGSFVEVGSDGGVGYFAVGGDSVSGVGNSVWWSEDLSSWEAPGSGSPLREAIVHAGQLFGVHGDRAGLVSVGLDAQSFISNAYPDIETGWERFTYIAALATDGETVVLGGLDDAGRPAMAVRGTTVQPTSLPVVADSTWSPVTEAKLALSDPNPPIVVTTGDRTFVLASGQVLEVEGVDSASPTIEPVLIDGDPVRADQLGRVGDVVWGFNADGGRLLTRGVDGGWASAAIPLQWVAAVLERSGGLVAVGYEENFSAAVAQRESDGGWALADDADTSVSVVAAIEGAVFGAREDGDGTVAPVVSRDGVVWETIGLAGQPDLVFGGADGRPFLRDGAEPAIVWLLDRWPDLERVDLPTSSPWSIQRHDAEVWVLGPGALWIRGVDAVWTQLPTGVQHGVTGSPGVIPGEVPTLVVSVDGRIELLRLDD